jgi:hypothetical protein
MKSDSPLDRVLDALRAHSCNPKQSSGDGYSARCPAHDDTSPSLSIGRGEDGRVLIHCHAGCEVAAVLDALKLGLGDLFCEDEQRGGQQERPLRVYTYTDEHGETIGYVLRFANHKFRQARPDKKGGVEWKAPARRVPYRLPELLGVGRGGLVFVVEGEKDADTLASECLVATTNPMGAGKWPAEWGKRYFGDLSVVVLADNDDAGRSHARDVVDSVAPYADEVRLVELPGLAEKGDVTDWFVAGHGVDELLDLVEAHEPAGGDDAGLLEFIDWSVAHDPVDALVDGFLMPGRWTQNIAGAKDGKSSLSMWVAIELSEGRDPFDATTLDPVSVVYCDGEMGRDDLEDLIRSMGHDPVRLANLHCTEQRPRLDTEAGALCLLWGVERHGARLVVLDGLNGFIHLEADENRSETWRQLFDFTVAPLKARGVAILSNDNMGKDPTRGSRGNSAKNDKADGVVAIKKTDNGVRLTTTLQRASAYFDHLDLSVEGFDRSRPIRYWRGPTAWPAGTHAAVALLDRLGIPDDWGGRKVRQALREANESVSNEVIAAAIRFRKANPIRQPKQP